MAAADPTPDGTPYRFDLATPDPEAASAFYAEVLGWQISGEPEPGHPHTARVDGMAVASIDAIRPPEGPGGWRVCFATPSADRFAQSVVAGGGSVRSPPAEVGTTGRTAIFGDPAGAVFGVWQPREPRGPQPRDRHGALAWCEVSTPDGDTAVAFYEALLGLKPERIEGVAYHTLHRGETPVCGVRQGTAQEEGGAAHWMAYFAVDDVDTAAGAIRAAGGAVRNGPFDTPHGRIAVAVDPFGAAFAVMQLPTG